MMTYVALLSFYTASIVDKIESKAYPYPLHTTGDVRHILAAVELADVYSWYSLTVMQMGPSGRTTYPPGCRLAAGWWCPGCQVQRLCERGGWDYRAQRHCLRMSWRPDSESTRSLMCSTHCSTLTHCMLASCRLPSATMDLTKSRVPFTSSQYCQLSSTATHWISLIITTKRPLFCATSPRLVPWTVISAPLFWVLSTSEWMWRSNRCLTKYASATWARLMRGYCPCMIL